MIEFLSWTKEAWSDYISLDPRDTKTIRRINKLILDSQQSPFTGLGKPEPLKEKLAGFWSRRIDETHRLVYAVDDNQITVIACRYHY